MNTFVQIRTSADSDFRQPVAVAAGTPVTIPVTVKDTDMPHSTFSLWVFRLTTDRPDESVVHFKVTIHKGRNVVDWPPHPDFYANGNERFVALNKHVKTHMIGIAESELYDGGATWAAPDKLVSWGTDALYVFMNVTSVSSSIPGASPTGYFLEFHNATDIGPEILFGNRSAQDIKQGGDAAPIDSGDLHHYAFRIPNAANQKAPLDIGGLDGPYQPNSRWGFRLMATFANTPAVGLCPGCFSYDIEYDLTIIAVHDPTNPVVMEM